VQNNVVIGLFAGLLLGVAFAAGGFGGFLATLVLGAAGVVVVRVIEGDLDLGEYLPNNSGRRRP
jgi:uncharacterized membrane protein YeaQ/YmgE (transglycosylase-associated protein family)